MLPSWWFYFSRLPTHQVRFKNNNFIFILNVDSLVLEEWTRSWKLLFWKCLKIFTKFYYLFFESVNKYRIFAKCTITLKNMFINIFFLSVDLGQSRSLAGENVKDYTEVLRILHIFGFFLNIFFGCSCGKYLKLFCILRFSDFVD